MVAELLYNSKCSSVCTIKPEWGTWQFKIKVWFLFVMFPLSLSIYFINLLSVGLFVRLKKTYLYLYDIYVYKGILCLSFIYISFFMITEYDLLFNLSMIFGFHFFLKFYFVFILVIISNIFDIFVNAEPFFNKMTTNCISKLKYSSKF